MKKNEYDVIIIGAGIGGLVCGCYLAKAGMKVLMVEKERKAGGCCKSFFINKIKFQAGPHSLSSLRRGGILNVILSELELSRAIEIKRSHLTDRFIAPDLIFNLHNNEAEILDEIAKKFPKEKKIGEFITKVINQSLFLIISKYRKYTFEKVLRRYVNNNKLNAIFSLFLLGNSGLPPSKINAAKALILLKEHFMDGGYFLKDGIDSLPIELEKKFINYSGQILFNSFINEKILFKNNFYYIPINNSLFARSKFVVCSSDMAFFVKHSLKLNVNNIYRTRNMEPSLSCFVLYLSGEKCNYKENNIIKDEPLTVWDIPHYDAEFTYDRILKGEIESDSSYFMVCNLSKTDNDSVNKVKIACNAPFRNREFWEKEKEAKTIKILEKIKNKYELFRNFQLQSITTPIDILTYTSNQNGATYGWAPYVDQSYLSNVFKKNAFKNIFFSSHWNTFGSGIPNVASSGRAAAFRIIKSFGVKSTF